MGVKVLRALLARAAAGMVLILMLASPSAAGPFADGQAAYDKGNLEEARRLWMPLASSGDPKVQFQIGQNYEQKDAAEAARWFRLAADQGLAPAQYSLANMYREGRGVPQNTAEAAKWFQKGLEQDSQYPATERDAEKGDASAQDNLGRMYLFGNDTEAVKWFRLAAEQGNTAAESDLARMYLGGRGVPQSDDEFLKWYRLAAAKDSRPEWWLVAENDGGTHSVSFTGCDPTVGGDECGGFDLGCSKLVIVADPRNSIILKRLAGSNPSTPTSRFEMGSASAAASVTGFQADWEDMEGDWDVTLGFNDLEGFFKSIEASAASGDIHAVIAGEAFDLTPRKSDRHILTEFAHSCLAQVPGAPGAVQH